MRLEEYLSLDREQLAVVLANPARDHELAMLITAHSQRATITPRKLPTTGKPEKQIIKCKTYRANI